MNNRLAAIVALLVLALGAFLAWYWRPGETTPRGVDVASIVKAVEDALTEAESKRVAGFPPLKKAVLELSTAVTKEGAASAKLLVFSIGGSVGSETGVTLAIEMAPPEPTMKMSPERLKSALAQAIYQAKSAFAQVGEAGATLSARSVEVEVKFGFIETGEVGGSTTPEAIKILTLDAKTKIKQSETHSVKLTFSGQT